MDRGKPPVALSQKQGKIDTMTATFGSATIDITPPVGIELFGYNRPAPSNAVLDRLTATAMVFTLAQTKVVLLNIDHIGMLTQNTEPIRRQIAKALDTIPANVLLTFTHTHSGPDADGDSPLSTAYRQALTAHLLHVATEADQNQLPCHLGWGIAHAKIGVNRRPRGPAGKAHRGVNPDGLVDDRIGVISLIQPEIGELLGVIVLCSAHANVLKRDNLAISGDFPNWTRRLLSNVLGCPVSVVIGAAGDCNPRWRGTERDLERMAMAISGPVLSALSEMQYSPLTTLHLISTTASFDLNPLPAPEQAADLAEAATKAWEVPTGAWLQEVVWRYQNGQRDVRYDIETQLLRLNDGAIAAIPMEPFAGLALELVKQTANECFFLNGYTNGCMGYLPTAAEVALGGYEIEWMPMIYGADMGFLMPVKPDAPEKILRHLKRLYEMAFH